jgi:hypothetical protein
MAIERQRSECVALYARWAATWNGELEISERIIAERFVANLIADAMMPPEDVCAALRGWVQAIRSRLSQISNLVEAGPPVDCDKLGAGALTAPDGTRILSQ